MERRFWEEGEGEGAGSDASSCLPPSEENDVISSARRLASRR